MPGKQVWGVGCCRRAWHSSSTGHHRVSRNPLGCSYINGKPFVVREAERPFSNLEYTGIDRERVESMEARLKQDVLAEVGGRGSWPAGAPCYEV